MGNERVDGGIVPRERRGKWTTEFRFEAIAHLHRHEGIESHRAERFPGVEARGCNLQYAANGLAHHRFDEFPSLGEIGRGELVSQRSEERV